MYIYMSGPCSRAVRVCVCKCVTARMHVCGGQEDLMLVGVGGSGKQSLTRLAAFAADCGLFEIRHGSLRGL